ncbi:FXYD domain-containing ion transport regulator 5-like [Hemicordylus capensis]|uniref:FXYD domain-containing ion transport regulator 5-like n=1 Tax=Hemicordylus capensis TaxID=884348 RepID=UPI0023049B85|nr:FXYD domain-containing ion transport regulator 5-like [Hemicordylus capensis]
MAKRVLLSTEIGGNGTPADNKVHLYCMELPSALSSWCCEVPAMKLLAFLLLALVGLSTSVDAQVSGSPASIVGEQVDYTKEPFLSTTAEKPKDETTTLALTSNFPQEEEVSTEVEVTSVAGVTPAVEVKTKKPRVGITGATRVTANAADVEIFHYDYYSLRKWGLIAAAILFILGILILTCGKHRHLPRCRGKKRARNYDVTQA